MVVNTPIWATTPTDDTRLNRMTNVANTGTVLAGLDKSAHGIFICTSTGSGLTKDHVYLCNADGDSLIDLTTMADHSHTGVGDGGVFNDLFRLNSLHRDLDLTKSQDSTSTNWDTTFASGGSVDSFQTDGTTNERYIRLRPNTTSGGAASIRYATLKLDFTRRFFYQTRVQIETATSLALHTGIGCDLITSADSNNRKVQAEVCTATNSNWWLRTADGSSNSASDSGIAITTNKTGVTMKFFSGDHAELLVGTGTILQKTTNIANDSTTASSNLITHSIKNSTAADRPLRIYGTRVAYYVSDDWV